MEDKIDTTGMTVISNSDELLDYVVKQLKNNFDKEKEDNPYFYLDNKELSDIKEYLKVNDRIHYVQIFNEFLKKQSIYFYNVYFENKLYFNFLIYFKSIHFECCLFNGDMDFNNKIKLYKTKHKLVGKKTFIKKSQIPCLDIKSINIDKLIINSCVFKGRFILNNLNSKSINCIKTVFHKKVELKKSKINKINLIDTNFNGIIDTYGSKFNKFYCEKCIFQKFAAFEGCEFGREECLFDPVVFKYSTFLNFVTFRNSKFYSGLNLDFANFDGEVNFLNININDKGTTKETYRVIKSYFDQAKNYIEANKYFAKEKNKHMQSLDYFSTHFFEKLILHLNKCISNFGQSYMRPLLLMILYAVLVKKMKRLYHEAFFQSICPSFNPYIRDIINCFNGLVEEITPIKIFSTGNMAIFHVLNYIIFASLTWQLIVAVKRHTKR